MGSIKRAEQRSDLRAIFKELMEDKYSPKNCKLPRRERKKAARLEAKIAHRALLQYQAANTENTSSAKGTLVKASDLAENEGDKE